MRYLEWARCLQRGYSSTDHIHILHVYIVSEPPNHFHRRGLNSNLEQDTAAGVRMGAFQRLRTIHIATHDSVAMGEGGPTHQPIELAALYRAMPNMLYFRPCDSGKLLELSQPLLKQKIPHL